MNISAIVASQRIFFKSHTTLDIEYRKNALRKLKAILQSNERLLHDAIYADFGKSEFENYATELGILYKEINYYLSKIGSLSAPQRVRTNLANLPGSSYIYQDPFGCTLVIGAWNYPYLLSLSPAIAAIAAGNTCIIKPSELPENTMNVMASLINENFPPEYLQVVTGGVEETTQLLQEKFDKIFFTGSTRVGKIVYVAAAKNLTPVTLELGGKSPVIITKSANLEIAAKRIAWGKFLNGGQTCIAPDYILIEESIKEKFTALLLEKIKESNYSDGAPHFTRIINKRNFDRLTNMIDTSKVIYGGNTNENTLYIEPTVMSDVSWDDKVMHEEIFGPILPIISFKKFSEAIETILEKEKPLSAYLFSNDSNEKDKFTTTISFGGGCINDVIMHIANEHLPFGGVGNSGIGNYHGKHGFYCFSHQKSILKKPTWGEPNLKYPPYTASKLGWIKRLLG
jgi:aldehyde dehydrogenase (NAD+)